MKPFFLAATAALALAAPALAAPETRYFACEGDWTATAPTTALSGGGGCVHPTAKPPVNGMTQYFVTGGKYAGEVRRIDLTLYSVASNPLYRQLGLPVTIDVTITADGQEVASMQNLPGSTQASGQLPGGFKADFSIADVVVEESATPKSWVVSVTSYYNDDPFFWAEEASDAPSAITFLAEEDLPPVEEEF